MNTNNDAPLPAADLARLVAMEKDIPAGEWRGCGAHRGGCSCGLVWNVQVDVPVLVAQSEKNSDEGEGFLVDVAKKHTAFIVALRNAAPSLLAEVGRLRKVEEAAQFAADYLDHNARSALTCDLVALGETLRAALSPSPEVGT